MLIGSKKRRKGKYINVFIDNARISPVTECKYLGVHIDNSLEWTSTSSTFVNVH